MKNTRKRKAMMLIVGMVLPLYTYFSNTLPTITSLNEVHRWLTVGQP